MHPKMVEAIFEAAADFFQCDQGDLVIEDKQEAGGRQANGEISQSWLVSASHTEVKCEVYFDAAFDTVTASKYE